MNIEYVKIWYLNITGACCDYQFPLGTLVAVAKRSYDGTEDYRFDVKSQTLDGNGTLSTAYVVVPQGGTPEFTQVLRSTEVRLQNWLIDRWNFG